MCCERFFGRDSMIRKNVVPTETQPVENWWTLQELVALQEEVGYIGESEA